MITDEKVIKYLRDLADKKRGSRFQTMEEFAAAGYVPIIQKEASEVLLFFVKMNKMKRIMELGTAIGYSAIRMADLAEDIVIDTIERDPAMISLARHNIAHYGMSHRIRIHEGEITPVMKTLPGDYDLVFIDAGKSHYQEYLEEALKHLRQDGIIICDNVLVRGMVADPGIMQKKHATAINGMKRFILGVTEHDDLESVLIPVGDGLLVIRRKEN